MSLSSFDRPLVSLRLRDVVLLAVTGLTAFLFWLLARPFVPAFAWAFALGVAVRPLHARVRRKLPSANAAALLSVLLVVAIVVVPAALLLEHLVQEAVDVAHWIHATADSGQWNTALRKYPVLGSVFNRFQNEMDWSANFKQIATLAASWATSAVSGSARAVIQLLMMLLALFYIFRDQESLLRGLRSVSPFSEHETELLFTRVADTVYASLYGSVAMKLLQGFLGGLMFWILGLPASLLWGAVMALLAVVPVLGTAVVWVPGALFLAWQGHWIKALVLVGWGAAVISTIDNVLYPIVVGKELRLPTLGIFVAVIGGLAAFGAAGVVLGPMILAATLALAEVWRQRAGPVLAEDQITTDSVSTY